MSNVGRQPAEHRINPAISGTTTQQQLSCGRHLQSASLVDEWIVHSEVLVCVCCDVACSSNHPQTCHVYFGPVFLLSAGLVHHITTILHSQYIPHNFTSYHKWFHFSAPPPTACNICLKFDREPKELVDHKL